MNDAARMNDATASPDPVSGSSRRGLILTVTPNPSLDRTYEVPALARGAVLRAGADRVEPGGKGVNVARAVAAAGHRTAVPAPRGIGLSPPRAASPP
jgi:1-phosphofructokinase